MFYAKKILEYFLTPTSLCFFLLLAGLVLLYARRISASKAISLLAFILLLAISLPWIPNQTLNYLQNQYPPLIKAPNTVKYIVVLGGGFLPIYGIPENNLLDISSYQRMVEGIRLWHQVPTAKLIFSGGDYYRQFSDGDLMTHIAIMLGVPATAIISENQSLDTAEEAILIKPIVKDSPFILVTSGYHMPRALQDFENQGMHPMPAPCDFQYFGGSNLLAMLPSLNNIGKLNIATTEYLGLARNKLQ